MAVSLRFYGTEESGSSKCSIELLSKERKEILLFTYDESQIASFVALDRETAIGLFRELKKQIDNLKM